MMDAPIARIGNEDHSMKKCAPSQNQTHLPPLRAPSPSCLRAFCQPRYRPFFRLLEQSQTPARYNFCLVQRPTTLRVATVRERSITLSPSHLKFSRYIVHGLAEEHRSAVKSAGCELIIAG